MNVNGAPGPAWWDQCNKVKLHVTYLLHTKAKLETDMKKRILIEEVNNHVLKSSVRISELDYVM